jgi:hydroxymethylpyrimidine/phosphomethylpyrimidine kinase
MVSTSGDRLLDADGVQMLIAELLPRAFVVTPNIPEAEALSGLRIRSMDDAREAARRILEMGPRAVIITGGHAPDTQSVLVDLLLDEDQFHEFTTARVDSRATHGTGCTYASAVAAGLALGKTLTEAAARAQQYVAGALAHAPAIGHGRGPVDHFWSDEWYCPATRTS